MGHAPADPAIAWTTAEVGAVPSIERPVTDLSDVLEPGAEEHLARRLLELRERTGVHMAILVIDTTGDNHIDSYSIEVAENWGAGGEGIDRGLLLVVAIKDRRSRLEVGYGLEGLITDAASGRILRRMRPGLKSGDYAAALGAGIDGVVERTRRVRPGEPVWPWHTNVVLWVLVVIALGFAVGFVTRSVTDRLRRGRLAARLGLWAVADGVVQKATRRTDLR